MIKRPNFLKTYIDYTTGPKDDSFSVRLTREIKKEICLDAKAAGMTQGEYIERLVLCRLYTKSIGDKKVFLAKQSLDELFKH